MSSGWVDAREYEPRGGWVVTLSTPPSSDEGVLLRVLRLIGTRSVYGEAHGRLFPTARAALAYAAGHGYCAPLRCRYASARRIHADRLAAIHAGTLAAIRIARTWPVAKAEIDRRARRAAVLVGDLLATNDWADGWTVAARRLRPEWFTD